MKQTTKGKNVIRIFDEYELKNSLKVNFKIMFQ